MILPSAPRTGRAPQIPSYPRLPAIVDLLQGSDFAGFEPDTTPAGLVRASDGTMPPKGRRS